MGHVVALRKIALQLYEKFWKIVILSAVIPKSTITCFIFVVGTSDQTYCAEYETPVLDEIDDLFSAKDKNVEFVLKGKNLTLRTPKGRKLKAHSVERSGVDRMGTRTARRLLAALVFASCPLPVRREYPLDTHVFEC
jgi:hypothetical protein